MINSNAESRGKINYLSVILRQYVRIRCICEGIMEICPDNPESLTIEQTAMLSSK